ncbi:hypothetical protein TARUN_7887 [Trichoderma arundinaceum]|uniref:Uncharacterized protein n=1 Tax=Trichoderma arundinaceum TaxID=490622 RepID=A0A395NEI5_TRIAR|nr:hypothetical protein TARUN_7887 [Trichoderma arundinaceum]
MEVDSDNGLLGKTAAGELVASEAWPALRDDILVRLDKVRLVHDVMETHRKLSESNQLGGITNDESRIHQIARNDFPIPKLPPPVPRPRLLDTRLLSPAPSSPTEQLSADANKENAPLDEPPKSIADSEPAAASQPPPSQPSSQTPAQTEEPGALPKQLADMVDEIKNHIGSFKTYPPHTIQRIAELILYPRAHYKALSSYLHALDRVAAVTSGTDTYPLPPPIPDMSSIQLNGDEPNDPAMAVSWSNPTAVAVGSDEALGGALLTPIPWITRATPPESVSEAPAGAQIHSESTETIEGPNGVGSIETVSVSINGVASIGHSRGVTQGELLRQEQKAGIVPVSQLTKSHDATAEGGRGGAAPSDDHPMGDEEEEAPHARGPDEIGVNDTGPQSETTSLVGEDGVEMQGIDLEAAVGRKHVEEKDGSTAGDKGTASGASSSEREKSPSAESVSSKREAEDDLEEDIVVKKVKEDASGDGDTAMDSSEGTPNLEEQKKDADGKSDEKKDDAADKDDAEKMEA